MIIIFICTGNTCRSPMAEIIAKDFFKKHSIKNNVYSYGISGEQEMNISYNAKKAIETLNLSVTNYKSKIVNKNILEKADLIITMTKEHKKMIEKFYFNSKNLNKIYTLAYLAIGEDKDILDPFMKNIESYKKCMNIIKNYIEIINWEKL